MKIQKVIFTLSLLSVALWAQGIEDMDLSDVVVIDDAKMDPENGNPSQGQPKNLLGADVENLSKSVSMDADMPDIPVIKEVPLPATAEMVFELPDDQKETKDVAVVEEEMITVDFPDEEIRRILRNVASLLDLNLVIPNDLMGRTSVKLRNVTWRQIFRVVLEPIKYTFVETGNIIQVKSFEQATIEPVDTEVFILNYAKAENIKESIGVLVDENKGGFIEVNERSNALIVTDRPSRMEKIQKVIHRLDEPPRQVMIESKFIEVTNSDVKNLGVNWASLSGYGVSLTDLPSNWDLKVGGEEEDDEEEEGGDTTSIVDTAVFTVPEFRTVLNMLKNHDDTRLVSNPTIVTLSNMEAKIAIGESYPLPDFSFNEKTNSTNVSGINYEDIGITLSVTPQVSSAGFINMKVIPEVSSRDGSTELLGTRVPIIQTRNTETNIIIKDGYTLAIGGMIQNTVSSQGTKVPLLGSLPGIGRLFKSSRDEELQRNLIIFITAKTLNSDGSYRDVFDSRMLDDMEIIPSELPGYQVPEDERKVLRQIENFRMQESRETRMNKAGQKVEAFRRLKNRRSK